MQYYMSSVAADLGGTQASQTSYLDDLWGKSNLASKPQTVKTENFIVMTFLRESISQAKCFAHARGKPRHRHIHTVKSTLGSLCFTIRLLSLLPPTLQTQSICGSNLGTSILSQSCYRGGWGPWRIPIVIVNIENCNKYPKHCD